MKRREFVLTLAAAATGAAAQQTGQSSAAQQPSSAKQAPAAQRTSPNDWVAAHPRLYFTAADGARLRARIERDPAFKSTWSRFMESAKRALDTQFITEEVAARGGGQHANYGQPGNQISSMGLTLGLAYNVTGEKQYAAKLRDAMLYYAGYERWNGPGKEGRLPQWSSELNGARFCYGFGVGYDAVHEFLTAAERTKIAGSMVRLGILTTLGDWVLPETRLHALDSMGHNWWPVCVAMAGVSTLALLGDDGRAPEWVDRISRNLALWFGYKGNVLQNKSVNFDRGGFYEGINYENYGLGEYLRYRLAYANVFPSRRQPRFEALEGATDFFLQTSYPTASSFLTVNFGDSGLRSSSAATVRLLLETGFTHPNAGWYLSKGGDGASRGADPLQMVSRRTPPPPAPPDRLPQSAIYRGIGWATMRSSWKDDATMLAVKSGFTWNHVHADAGSFILFHNGVNLITDSGTSSYSDPLYGGYYVQSRAHNVILFNGEGQPTEDIRRGVKTPGQVYSLLDGMGLKYVYADSTGPMARHFTRNFRHWLWLGGAILVFDDVRAHQAGRLDWLLHHDGVSGEAGGNRVTLTSGKAKAEVRFLFPKEVTVREEMGYADHQTTRQVPYFVFSPRTPSREEKFLAAILPYPVEGEPAVPTLEPLDAPDAIGVRLKQGGEVTDVYLNLNADGRRMHDNSNNIIDGWDTDAYLLALTRPETAAADPETVTRYFVSCGSYLRKRGRVMLDTLSKVEAVWRPGGKTEVLIQGQEEIDAFVGTAARPASLVVNGRETAFQYSARTGLAGFRVGGAH